MVDFLMISTRIVKRGVLEIYPKFIIKKSSDLMIRGGDFYAIWDEERGLWSNDEQDALRIIDRELDKYKEENEGRFDCDKVKVLHMWDAESGMIDNWHKYCQRQMRDYHMPLDENLIFANTEMRKKDYASRRLDYPLEEGDISSWETLISTLYLPEERHKIEWSIGAIVSGDSKKIQKFLVLYGSAGTGKSTILNIIQQLFDGYYSVFDARALGSSSNSFALESFKNNPLVAIQHDGDLSRIEDNTRLNSLVSHELMTVNEKFKAAYTSRFNAFLYMGTNKPVKITDAKSGLIRRLIDVTPSGDKLKSDEYNRVMKNIDFELGAIAKHCLDLYLENPGYYDKYIPISMMGASNDFYNFVLDSYFVFKEQNGTTLKCAWEMYKTYCDEARVPYPLSKRIFKEELTNYFKDYKDRYKMDDDSRVRNYYNGFLYEKFTNDIGEDDDCDDTNDSATSWIELKDTHSIIDTHCTDCMAQYVNDKGNPISKWDKVTTKLSDMDTSEIHYVKLEPNHIVIDFDLKDSDGNKSLEENIKAATDFPKTYVEVSKGGGGLHLHYIYTGDVTKLSSLYSDGIEVKTFSGKSSLRRRLSLCNDLPIANINSGLPLKGEKIMLDQNYIKNEKGLRTLLIKNLRKEIHPGTKPSMDFMYKLLEDAYASGMNYDVSDMKQKIFAFGAASSNQAEYCIKIIKDMKFKSENNYETVTVNKPVVFYDVEVFPNLFLVNWKMQGDDNPVIRMINPTPAEVEDLLNYRLVGFNCRRYDNHILYGRIMGYNNQQIYNLSQNIITKGSGFFGEAYNLSYTDVYDFAAKKQSLKKWEIELGLHHQELGLPWDEPVSEDKWIQVAEYCDNDVLATEAVFNKLDGDFTARKILAELAGMSLNDTTNALTTRIIFGKERKPSLVYTDLATGERFE